MNIMSCYGFSKYPISKVILTCHSDLVTYYLSNGIVIAETKDYGLDNIPIRVQNKINAVGLHSKDSLLT